MINRITYPTSAEKVATVSPNASNQIKKSQNDNVSPTYSDDILSKTSDTVQVTIVKCPVKSDNVKSREEIIKATCSFVPTAIPYDDSNRDFHVYRIGDNGEKIEMPFTSSEIVSQTNATESRSYYGLLEDGKICEVNLQNSNNSSNENDKPLDSTTFKNVILKAMKLLYSANNCKESITGEGNTHLSASLSYDPSTKKADFTTFIESHEKQINELFEQYNDLNDDSKIESTTYSKFQDDIWDLMNNIL